VRSLLPGTSAARLYDQHVRFERLSGITINWPGAMSSNGLEFPSYQPLLNVGAGAESMGAFTGVFQNRFNPSANAIWTHGKHTITFGGSYEYSQLNYEDQRNQLGVMTSQDINQFLQGELIDDYLYSGTYFMSGNPNRYWRAMKAVNMSRTSSSGAAIFPSPQASALTGKAD